MAMPAVAEIAHISTEQPVDTIDNQYAHNAWLLWLAAHRAAVSSQGTRKADGGITAILAMNRLAAELWPTVNWDNHTASTAVMNPIYNYLRSSGNATVVSRACGVKDHIEWFLSDAWIVSSSATHRHSGALPPTGARKPGRRTRGKAASPKAPKPVKTSISGSAMVDSVVRAGKILGIDTLANWSKAVKTGDPDLPFACPECGQKFKVFQGVGSHRKGHVNENVAKTLNALIDKVVELQSGAGATREWTTMTAITGATTPVATFTVSSPDAEMDVERALEVLTEYVTRPEAQVDTGVVEMWRERAEAAEARLTEAAEVLRNKPIGEAIVALMGVFADPGQE